MNQSELNEARSNPDFLEYLEKTRVDAISSKNIEALYEVLDTMLILDLDESKINSIYEHILSISFDEVQIIIDNGKKLSLDNHELYLVRSFYEHAIEKWSNEQFDAAKELFFVLCNIIEDEILEKSLNVHLLALASSMSLDDFYEKKVDSSSVSSEEKYAYFIDAYNFNIDDYLEENKIKLEKEYASLKHLLD
ncbi:MAG: hypothetical protein HRT41_03675 [Campylobacteraceae bacterium]|nr:hypothetical protein [Campylobacteraceae bacterium]